MKAEETRDRDAEKLTDLMAEKRTFSICWFYFLCEVEEVMCGVRACVCVH